MMGMLRKALLVFFGSWAFGLRPAVVQLDAKKLAKQLRTRPLCNLCEVVFSARPYSGLPFGLKAIADGVDLLDYGRWRPVAVWESATHGISSFSQMSRMQCNLRSIVGTERFSRSAISVFVQPSIFANATARSVPSSRAWSKRRHSSAN